MTTRQTTRILCAAGLFLVIPLGLASKVYSGWGQGWVEGYSGDILFEMAWIFFIAGLWPRVSARKLSLWVFGMTSVVEVLQLWQPPWLQAMRATLPGKLLLGSTFVWADFFYYGLGCLIGWVALERFQAWGRVGVPARGRSPRP